MLTSKQQGSANPALHYTTNSGSLVAGDNISGSPERAPGEALGVYDIGPGTLALSSDYVITFKEGSFTVVSEAAFLP